MKLRLNDGLPFTKVHFVYHGKSLNLENVLIDTGSAGTIFAASKVHALDLDYEPEDEIQRIRGVGGSEFVYLKTVDVLAVGALEAKTFTIQIGAMDYGFPIDGILGMDFLLSTGAYIDLAAQELSCSSKKPV